MRSGSQPESRRQVAKAPSALALGGVFALPRRPRSVLTLLILVKEDPGRCCTAHFTAAAGQGMPGSGKTSVTGWVDEVGTGARAAAGDPGIPSAGVADALSVRRATSANPARDSGPTAAMASCRGLARRGAMAGRKRTPGAVWALTLTASRFLGSRYFIRVLLISGLCIGSPQAR